MALDTLAAQGWCPDNFLSMTIFLLITSSGVSPFTASSINALIVCHLLPYTRKEVLIPLSLFLTSHHGNYFN
jgi:hypothetical protein